VFSRLKQYVAQSEEAAPLAVFRIFFGLLMLWSLIRFWALGWIDKLYLQPQFHFSFYGFEWVKPMGIYTYALFALCSLAAILVALGLWYRWAMAVFFLSFTYIELMDKTTYLNHYYFISVLSLIMLFLPASAYFSLDAWRKPKRAFQRVPRYTIDVLKLLLVLVYFYAGLAKLNSDWLLHAQPLATWLPGRYDIPLLGSLLQQTWVHYAFSWGGMLYDLSIPFLLLYRPTRKWGFALVVVFHLLTRILFPIGMFPYIMIVSALIFFRPAFHHRLLQRLARWLRTPKNQFDNGKTLSWVALPRKRLQMGFLVLILGLQLLLPWRYLLYPGELFWHEQGYRFSWRVMLMEKAGYTNFKVIDPASQETFIIDNSKYLTAFQEKQMSFQPDFILEYAHWLEKHLQATQKRGDLKIYAQSYVALNGRSSQPFINPSVDLTQQKRGWATKNWILPFNDTISGL
jgi:hypothetical protein